MGKVLASFQVIVLIGATLQLLLSRKPITSQSVARALLQWSLPVNVGLGGIWAFIGHFFMPNKIAGQIGWPAGNPFQTEVAMANLSFGIVGLLCTVWRGMFWRAAAIGQGLFLLGAASVHIREMIRSSNFEPGNAGPIFYWDILVPLAHFVLLAKLAPEDRR